MSLLQDFKTRLSTVAGFAGIEEAADLAALMKAGTLPQKSPWGFVLPAGFTGGAADAMTGLFRQPYEPVISVVIVVRTIDDPKARKALATIDGLVEASLTRICGWAPESAIGVFRAMRGRLVDVTASGVFYQIDFALQDQLRIET